MPKFIDPSEDYSWVQDLLTNSNSFLLGAGLLMKVLRVRLQQKTVLVIVFFSSIILSLPYVFDITFRYGVDYVAYIQQAGAVYNGERDYTRLSSHLGPCYYPAGHIWHYLPAFWLHLQTQHAEQIIKVGHFVIYAVTLMLATHLAYLYEYVGPKMAELQKSCGSA